METDTCRLMRSTITNKIIMFGACVGHDHQDHEMEFEEDHMSTHSTQIDPNVQAVSALASVMEHMAITDFEDVRMVSDEE